MLQPSRQIVTMLPRYVSHLVFALATGRSSRVCASEFFFSSRRRHTRFDCDWSSDVCSSDLVEEAGVPRAGSFVKVPRILFQERRQDGAADEGADGRVSIGGAVALGITLRTLRSEERRVGKECRSRWSPYH